jgi:NAD(P)-dependent dehydrogenase (short-subunit alcohol dehydrogenase family)
MTQQFARFQGKVAIVTGATADPSIGRATALRLAREGASVVINGRTDQRVRAAEKAMQNEGLAVVGIVGSAEDDSVLQALVDTAIARFGRIDGVVNTVGGATTQSPPMVIEKADLVDTFALNTWPTLALIQYAVRAGLGAGGAVVNVSSDTVNKTTPSMIAYAAAKAALNAMTRTLARDLSGQGIRVNAVSPALTRTTATKPMWENDEGAAMGRNFPLGRLTTAEDIAGTTAFLLSDDAASVTGMIIDVDAGAHLMGGFSPITQATSSEVGAGR